MKAILLLTLCIAVAAQTSDLDYDTYKKYEHGAVQIPYHCNSTSDCFANYCCIQHHPKKEGFCAQLGSEGKRCSEFHMCARTAFDKFCPCFESLVCERDPDDSFSRCREKND